MRKNILLITFGVVSTSFACTTFASFNGESGLFMMAKNRDNNPDRQILEVVAEKGKYKYLALSRQDVPNFVSAGINEYNLSVFNEVTIEYSSQAVGGIADDFSKDILQNYKTVKDVIPDISKLVDKFPDPVFYQVADGKYILSIEVAANHKYAYNLKSQGIYAHTNNFLEQDMIKNYSYSDSEKARWESSNTRYLRAKQLLAAESLVSFDSLQNIGLDRNAGNDDSIFRTGVVANNPRTSRSLAFFAISIDPRGKLPSVVNVNMYNMSEKYNYTLTPQFWQSYESGFNILLVNTK
jgi:hypothetical protein